MLNSVNLIGRFTRDPELRSTPSGVSTCSFSIAVDRNFVRQGEERKADFINCVAWRQTAELISRFFKKGNLIALEGSIQTRNWDDNEGKRHYATEVVVDRVHFVESKSAREARGESYGGYDNGGQQGGYGAPQGGYSGGYGAPQPQQAPSYESSYGGLGDPISLIGTDDDLPF